MATSGSSDFNVTRNQIIYGAGRKVNAVATGGTMSTENIDAFNQALNAMVKHWQGQGLHVWTTAEATLFPQVDQVKYGLSISGTDHVTQTFYETAITTDEADGQTVLSVDSTANMTVADNIGVVVDDGTLHWSTIASKTSSTVTINAALDDSAASGNAVFTYTSKIVRPLKIVDARRYNIDGATDTPIEMVANRDYHAIPQKADTGTITQAFYDRQLSTGYLYLWQPPSAITDLVKFTWHRPIEDFDAAGNNPDLPQEWIQAIIFNLAAMMIPEFPVTPQNARLIVGYAEQLLEDMKGYDREEGSIFFQPG